MRLPINPKTRELFENSQEYYTDHANPLTQRVQYIASTEQRPSEDEPGFDEFDWRVFDVVENPDRPELVDERFAERRRIPNGVRGLDPVICRKASLVSDDCWYADSVS